MNEPKRIRDGLARVSDARELLEGVLAFSPIAHLVYESDGRCVLGNEAAVTLFGASSPPDRLFEETPPELAALATAARRSFGGDTVHVPAGNASGMRAAFEATTYPIRDAAGTVRWVACAMRATHSERDLRDEVDKLARLRDAGIIGVFEFETQSRRAVGANDAFLTMFGYDRDDLERGAISLAQMTPPDYSAADALAIREIVTKGTSTPREKELFHKDGRRIPVILAGAVLQNDPSHGIGFVLDNTRQRRAEEEVARSEARFRALVAHSSDVVVVLEPDGTVLYVSDSIERILGWNPRDVIGSPGLLAHIHPADAESAAARRAKAIAHPGIPVLGEERIVHKDGRHRILSVVVNSMLEDPNVRALVVNLRDVTEQRAVEQQFLQAQKMEAIGQLAGGVAHDFNNMLSAILGFAGIVASELPPADPLVADVKEIITAAERASTLTRQLLAFSRKQILEPKVINLSELARDLERMLQRLIGEDVDLRMSLAAKLAPIKVDPAQLEQVVLNLVINARDAVASKESGRITIETANVVLDGEYARSHRDVTPGPYVMLCVSDNGAGMEKHVRERIFEPFFTTKATGSGTGLGLATVFGIVKQSGGHIWLYSEPGEGTTFKIYFPQADGGDPVSAARAPQASLLRGTETILLVEDEPGVRSFAKRALQRAGYVVLDAANGGEALLIAEQHSGAIDVLLTDVVMPRMSGRALAERLMVVKPHLAVIYMSGYTENTIVHHGVLDEGTAFIPKPIALDVLLTKVRSVLDRRRSHGQQ